MRKCKFPGCKNEKVDEGFCPEHQRAKISIFSASDINFKTKITTTGNSLCVIIPDKDCKMLGLKKGNYVEVAIFLRKSEDLSKRELITKDAKAFM